MKYENRAPMHFGAPTSQRYRDNFDAIDWGRKPDPNPVALKEYQQWATAADEPRDVATIRRIEDGWVRYRQITHDGWGGNDDLPEAEFRAKFHVLLGRWG